MSECQEDQVRKVVREYLVVEPLYRGACAIKEEQILESLIEHLDYMLGGEDGEEARECVKKLNGLLEVLGSDYRFFYEISETTGVPFRPEDSAEADVILKRIICKDNPLLKIICQNQKATK